ncbi:hypothetical protein N7533_004370 [Penicillium manginii]|uniref:uncharacterized protein n=1 Tax=Penicillium manginii TaxID=203109 RepID=UPI002547022B|nr:uncharacterized protein N7533_004370 [Penicillium manginii]KAJ5754827.1 hypothetical protein N7533_004370 [Penicillium manginii]
MLDQEPLTASHEYTYNERDTLAEMEWRSQPKQHDHDELRPRKRQKTIHHSALPTPRREDYTIAWICALHIEMAAARAMLDECHEPLPIDTDDNNTYVLGRIKRQNIVIACLPTGQYGTNNAANVMTNMRRTFTNIRDGLMVGIGGGAPGKVDVRLGDIVVGTSVIQYDLGKILGDKQSQLHRTATPRFPRPSLLTAASTLRSKHELCASQVPRILRQRLEAHTQYSRPSSPDRLFHATYSHQSAIASCNECDQSKLVPRCQRAPTNNIMIHYGAIASGNQVMKHSTTRDTVTRELDVICFEMEAAGLMDILPCLPIRGICDYSDSHKSNEWQRYAAATAAAYARELIEELPVIEAGSRTADSQARSEMDELQQTNQALKMEVRELNVRLRLQQSRLSPQVPYRNLVAINDALGETYSFSLNYIDSFEVCDILNLTSRKTLTPI